MNEKMERALNILAAAIIVAAGILIVVVFYMAFVQANPPATFNLPLSVDKAAYLPGDSMEITSYACRHTDAPVTLYTTMINVETTHLYELLPRDVNALPRGCATSTITVTLPPDLPPGRYVRSIRADYHVNVIADRVVEMATEEFNVLALEE